MRILVTGGSGFIGLHTCSQLVRDGHEPIIFDHVFRPTFSWYEYEMFIGDVRDRVDVTEAVSHVDGVIHLAAVLGSSETVDNPYPAIDTNIYGAVNVMEACVQYNVPMVMTTVGNGWMRSDGAGTYTIVKECASDLCQMYRNYRGLRANVVRPVNAYGPGQKAPSPWGGSKVRKILPTFINQALDGKSIEVYGDGEQVSDMCWVGDVVTTLARALYAADRSELYPIAEVGPSVRDSLSVNEVALHVRTACAYHTGKLVDITHLPMRNGEKKGITSADPSTLAPYGIQLTPFSDGLKKTVEYYYQQRER